jgi:ABC-type bacteriocin/lantibiotic exporter with double-glycine peptidase domain
VVTLLSIGMLTFFQGLIGSIALIIYSPYFVFVVFGLIVFFVVVIKVIGRNGYSTAVEVSKIKYEFVNWLFQIANNWDFVNRLGTKKYLSEKTNHIINKFLHYRQHHFRILLHQNIATYVFYSLISTLMILLGGFLVINGSINLGQFVAAEVIFFSAISSLIRFVNQLDSYYELTAAFDKVSQLTNLKPELHSKNKFTVKEIDQIGFTIFDKKDQQLDTLKALSNQIFKKNKPIALLRDDDYSRALLAQAFIGKNKSVNPFYKIQNNFYDTLDRHVFLSKIQLIRKNIIFDDTLLNNIRIVQDKLDLDKLQKLFNHFDFFTDSKNPISLDQTLDSSNLNITNLQLTKLQIIRALIAEPEILIIDSYLDGINPKTAQMLITKILTFKKDLIFIVITGSKTISNLMPTYLEF